MPKENIFYSKGLTIPKFEVFISVVSSPNICKGNKSILEKEREVREIDEHRYMSSTDLQAPVKSKFMSATDLQAPLKVNLLRNLIVSWKAAALSPHENIILGDVNIHPDSQNCWTDKFNTVLSDFDFIQHMSTPTHKQRYP